MDAAWKWIDFLVLPAGHSFHSCLHPIGVKGLLKLPGNDYSHLDNCTTMPFWLKMQKRRRQFMRKMLLSKFFYFSRFYSKIISFAPVCISHDSLSIKKFGQFFHCQKMQNQLFGGQKFFFFGPLKLSNKCPSTILHHFF